MFGNNHYLTIAGFITLTWLHTSPQGTYIVMEAIPGADDGEVRLVVQQFHSQGDTAVPSTHDHDVLVSRQGRVAPVSAHLHCRVLVLEQNQTRIQGVVRLGLRLQNQGPSTPETNWQSSRIE